MRWLCSASPAHLPARTLPPPQKELQLGRRQGRVRQAAAGPQPWYQFPCPNHLPPTLLVCTMWRQCSAEAATHLEQRLVIGMPTCARNGFSHTGAPSFVEARAGPQSTFPQPLYSSNSHMRLQPIVLSLMVPWSHEDTSATQSSGTQPKD